MTELVVVRQDPRMTWRMLAVVVEREGITSRELMDKFNLSPAQLRSVISSLHKRGYVRTIGSRFHYYPTEKATRKFGRGR